MKYLIASMMLMLSLALVPATTSALPGNDSKEASQEVRNNAALSYLKAKSDTVTVYAQGLCCLSCAIGIRKKVSGLDFVDQDRLDGGIELDAKTQLVTIAIKKGTEVDPSALREAIDNAGYKPMYLYTLKSGELVTLDLAGK